MRDKTRSRWVVSFYNQWKFTKVNWIDFNVIHLSFENSLYSSSCEMTVGLFGLNLYMAYFYGTFQEEASITPETYP